MPVASVVKKIIIELKKPDDFSKNWYAWATNQIGHFVIGLMLAAIFTAIGYWLFGEIPYKLPLWLSIAITYALWESMQGWNGRDTIEDWLFVALYGAGGAIYVFTEKTLGDSMVTADLFRMLIPLGAVIGHIAAGVYCRIKRGALNA